MSLCMRLLLAALMGLVTGACGGQSDAPNAPAPPKELEPPAAHKRPELRVDPSELLAEHDRFPSLTDPAHVAPEVSWLRAEDQVIGVVVGGEARAYPTWMIGYHHIVNDRLGNTPILVAY